MTTKLFQVEGYKGYYISFKPSLRNYAKETKWYDKEIDIPFVPFIKKVGDYLFGIPHFKGLFQLNPISEDSDVLIIEVDDRFEELDTLQRLYILNMIEKALYKMKEDKIIKDYKEID